MFGLILAAGRGTRMKNFDMPKCLLKFGDRYLIDYQLDCFHEFNIDNFVVVTGFESNLIKSHLGQKVDYEFLQNFYDVNNLYSVWQAKNKITDDFVCVYGDLLFHKEILKKCINSDANICLMIEKNVRNETMKVIISDNKIIQVNKSIPINEADGNFIGMAKFSKEGRDLIFREISDLINDGNRGEYYTKAIENLISKGHKIDFEYTDDYPWIDIDEMKEFEDAKKIFSNIK